METLRARKGVIRLNSPEILKFCLRFEWLKKGDNKIVKKCRIQFQIEMLKKCNCNKIMKKKQNLLLKAQYG